MVVSKNVSKSYGEKQVLKEISFHIAPAECVGIIGRNGAGKTTLLNLLSGVRTPDDGFLRVCGSRDMLQDLRARRTIAYVSSQCSQLWNDMKLCDSFDNCAAMYQMDKQIYAKRLHMLVHYLGIEDCLQIAVPQLSLGQRMRGELVYALLPQPQLLLMDEAMVGLDVSVREKVIHLMEYLKEEGLTTIIYTSHNLAEIERLCERILLLEEGRILFDGSIDELMRELAPEYRMELEIEGAFPDLEDIPIEKYTMHGNRLTIHFFKQKVETAAIIKHLLTRCQVKNIHVTEPDLEAVIQNIYGRRTKND